MIIIERKKENFYERGRGNKETCAKKVMKLVKKYNQSSQGRKKKTCTKKKFESRQHIINKTYPSVTEPSVTGKVNFR